MPKTKKAGRGFPQPANLTLFEGLNQDFNFQPVQGRKSGLSYWKDTGGALVRRYFTSSSWKLKPTPM